MSSSSSWWTSRPASRAASWCPSSDATLAAVSRHKSLLERHYIVACTDWEITKLFVDKKHTYALAEQAGVPAPKTAVPHSIEDVERYAQTASTLAWSSRLRATSTSTCSGGRWSRQTTSTRCSPRTGRQADAGFEVMLQEFIPGDSSQGVNYNSYSGAAKPWSSSPQRRYEMPRAIPGRPAAT